MPRIKYATNVRIAPNFYWPEARMAVAAMP